MSDSLAKIFNIDTVVPVEVISPDGVSTMTVEDGDEDIDHAYARVKHLELSAAGSEAIQIAMRICRESENPRAIEVLSGLLKNLSDVNKSLLTLNKDRAEAKTAKSGKGSSNTPQIGQAVQTQNVYIGSSKDLNKIINEQGKLNGNS